MSGTSLPLLALSSGFGLVIGSFLATLVLRVPRGEPVVFDRSACPHCGHVLSARELIPLVSWLVQRRKCRACGHGLSMLYPLMEAGSAATAVAAAWAASGWAAIAVCLAGWSVLVLAGWLWVRSRPDVRL